ncbi:MAG TPA: hypothetical protein VFI22_15920 [Thermomicrobiales bacterium]|nr:hypothetical protein [Thermomicrobiales bacterium]
MAMVAILATLALAACDSGSALEAQRAEQRDMLRTPVLDKVHATRTSERFFPPTGTPASTPRPVPTLAQLVITTGVGAGNAPQGNDASVPSDAGTVYAGAQLGNVVAGHHVVGIWTDAQGNEVGRSAVDITAAAETTWVAFPLRLSGQLAPGEYAVYVDVDDRRVGSLAFTITAPGTAPQALPDLPANPQAAAPAAPTRAGTRPSGDDQSQNGDGSDDAAGPGGDNPQIVPGGPSGQ